MAAGRSLDTLVRAARLYYEDGLSQGEVARRLGLSGATVSRVLAQAREQGIVEVLIHDPRSPVQRVHEIEQQLIERFGLADARVGVASGRAPELCGWSDGWPPTCSVSGWEPCAPWA